MIKQVNIPLKRERLKIERGRFGIFITVMRVVD